MARLLRASRNALRICSYSPEIQSPSFLQKPSLNVISRKAVSTTSDVSDETLPTSLLEANIVRILRNEIHYQSEYAPPHEHATEYKSFTLQDQIGDQFITMKGKFGDSEVIKIEATMFDGCTFTPKLGDDSVGHDLHLHISVLVNISKGNGSESLELVCSAWPGKLEVQNVYLHRGDRTVMKPYVGPDLRSLNPDFRKSLCEYLKARGIDDELSVFLHDYMMNKDRVELIQWLRRVKSYVQ